jgi:hypothetical protein
MRNHEAAMQVYVKLAVISEQSHQSQVGDRFLLLASVEACRAGWPEVADRCRQRLISRNASHLANRHETIADALRDHDFQLLVARWERYCPYEKAEAMLRHLDLTSDTGDGKDVGDQMLDLLDGLDASQKPQGS